MFPTRTQQHFYPKFTQPKTTVTNAHSTVPLHVTSETLEPRLIGARPRWRPSAVPAILRVTP